MTLKYILLLFVIVHHALTQNPTQKALAQAQVRRTPFTRSLQNIFTTLPTQTDLQQIIYSADAVALTKLIQVIQLKQNQIPCDALVVYIESIIGMIKSAKHRRELLIAQMDIIYETAKQEIIRIQRELARLDNQKKKLNITDLRNNILHMILELDNSYDIINEQQNNLQGFQAQIIGYRTDIKLKQQDSKEKRKLLIETKLHISSLDTQIYQLEQRLADLRQQRFIARNNAENIQKQIQNNTNYIKITRQKILGLENSIETTSIKIDQSKSRAAQLQVALQRMRTDLNSQMNKNTIFSQQIDALKKQLQIQQQRFLEQEHETLSNMIRVWGLILPKYQELSADIYYRCYGQGSVKTLKTGNVNVYILNGANIPDYIFNNYGVQSFSQGSNFRVNYQFYIVDIFGRSWNNKYGQPFNNSSSVLQSNQLYVFNDFSCLNPSIVQSGTGKIVSISSNIIRIQNNNNQNLNLRVGSCSRIQSTRLLPQIGQTIYYKGVNISEQLNLYTATCF